MSSRNPAAPALDCRSSSSLSSSPPRRVDRSARHPSEGPARPISTRSSTSGRLRASARRSTRSRRISARGPRRRRGRERDHRKHLRSLGSGFFRHNLVGNDLDYFTNVHLGALALEPDRMTRPREILRRLKIYPRAAEARAERYRNLARRSPASWTGCPRAPPIRTRTSGATWAIRSATSRPAALTWSAPSIGGSPRSLPWRPARAPAVGRERAVFLQRGRSFSAGVLGHPGSRCSSSSASTCRGRRAPALGAPVPAGSPPAGEQAVAAGALGGLRLPAGAAAFEAAVLTATPMSARRLEYAQGLASLSFERQVRHYPIKFLKRLHLLPIHCPVLAPAERERSRLALRELKGPAATEADQIKTFGRDVADPGPPARSWSSSTPAVVTSSGSSPTSARPPPGCSRHPRPAGAGEGRGARRPLSGRRALPGLRPAARGPRPFVDAAHAVARSRPRAGPAARSR